MALCWFSAQASEGGAKLGPLPKAMEALSVNSMDFGMPSLFPNELNPEKLISILEDAPAGLYVSTGLERSFIGAAIVPRATGMVIIDINQKLVDFSKININHLLMATTPEEYVHLRQGIGFSSDHERFDHQFNLNEVEIFHGLSMVMKEYFLLPEEPGTSGVGMSSSFPYSVNYWVNHKLFNRLHAFALSDRMRALRMDFFDRNKIEKLIEMLRAHGEKVGVLDLSNVLDWLYSEVGAREAARVFISWMKALAPIMENDSRIVMTFARQNFEFEYVVEKYSELSEMSGLRVVTWLMDHSSKNENVSRGRRKSSNLHRLMAPNRCENLFEFSLTY